jgi:hypothetical protein
VKVIKVIVDELPATCNECRFFRAEYSKEDHRSYCQIENYRWQYYDECPKWCPLGIIDVCKYENNLQGMTITYFGIKDKS